MEFKGTKHLKILRSNEAGFGLGNNYSPDVYVTVWGNDSESKANALLISKAPEMLDMLHNYLSDLNNIVGASDARENRIRQVKQLIKSATEI